jgi:predicted nucleic-acid-binding Zn-ribbon protein
MIKKKKKKEVMNISEKGCVKYGGTETAQKEVAMTGTGLFVKAV